jgi:hypothetical protein
VIDLDEIERLSTYNFRRRLHRFLNGPAPAATPVISIADVARDRRGAAPRDTLGVISEHIRLQVRGG